MELIDKSRLKDDIAVLLERNSGLIDEWLANCIDDVIDEQPTIEAEPIKHGRWERYLKEGLPWKCSECGSRYTVQWNYCPNCGARMDGKDNVLR